jgi:hypothetical protein
MKGTETIVPLINVLAGLKEDFPSTDFRSTCEDYVQQNTRLTAERVMKIHLSRILTNLKAFEAIKKVNPLQWVRAMKNVS